MTALERGGGQNGGKSRNFCVIVLGKMSNFISLRLF